MSTPEPTTEPRLHLPVQDGVLWWVLVVAVSAGCAWAAMQSLQTGCAFALFVLTIGLYLRNRTAGLVVVWLTWLVAPFLRRVLFLSYPVNEADPLALAPFAITAAIVGLELVQVTLSRRSRRLMWLVVGGYALGIPAGLILVPRAATFALFAYLTAVGCFVIGYREAGSGRTLTLPTTILLATPLLALYALAQYYLPLPEWDHVWRETADINSVGAPEEGKIRVWSTLNSPGTFATVLGVSLLALLTLGRMNALRVLAAALVVSALALTFVRSAWIGVAVALIAITIASRGRAITRVAAVGVVIVALGSVALTGSTSNALSDRVDTFGYLEGDESGQARVDTPAQLVPVAVQSPLGFGLGRAGESARLVESGATLRYTDNGYMSILLQVGPVGFLLVMTTMVTAFVSSWRNALRRPQGVDVLVVGVMMFFAVTLLAGDQLFGLLGMIFWYTSGFAMRRRELLERTAAT